MRFAPDGATASGLTVRESVALTLPAAPKEPPRTITAATLTATAEGGTSLNAARFVDNVEYREAPAGGTPRIVRSRTLDTATAPGLGSMSDARFAGAVRFEEGQVRAASGQARYLVDRGRIDLDGVDETTGQSPRVTDGQVAIDAGHIEITTDPRRITAARDVRSVMTPVAGAPAGQAAEVRRAGMLEKDQPVYAASAALDYDSTSRVAVYTAEAPALARLWQGDTTIQAERLTVDDATGNLAGKGRVATTFVIEETDEKTGKRERTTSIGSADDFLYEDAPRKATYTGQRPRVRPAGRSAGVAHRAVPRARGQRARAPGGVHGDLASRRHARRLGRSADVHRGRRALPRRGVAGEDRRGLPRDDGADFDFLQVDQ